MSQFNLSLKNAEDTEELEKKKAAARYHWGLIRTHVNDRIRARRKRKMGFNKDRAMNKVRAQAKAALHPEHARRDIFERLDCF